MKTVVCSNNKTNRTGNGKREEKQKTFVCCGMNQYLSYFSILQNCNENNRLMVRIFFVIEYNKYMRYKHRTNSRKINFIVARIIST